MTVLTRLIKKEGEKLVRVEKSKGSTYKLQMFLHKYLKDNNMIIIHLGGTNISIKIS
jgi:hypothetical protein